MGTNNFRDYKPKVGGLVENPVELSLSELEVLANGWRDPCGCLQSSTWFLEVR